MKLLIKTCNVFLVMAACAIAAPGHAEEAAGRDAQTILHMLDYVSVDYGEAVQDGKVLDEGEYQEQAEFMGEVVKLLDALPDNPRRSMLLAGARTLSDEVNAKQEAGRISGAAQNLRRQIIQAYNVPIAPRQAPDLARAKALYQEHCAACHGIEGRGDGMAGKALEPAPSNFLDIERMDQRSVYSLFNTISLGLGGTGMASFAQLTEDERWGLAFFVSNLRTTPDALEQGGAKAAEYRQSFPDLSVLANLTANEVRASRGEAAVAVFAALRAQPQTVIDAKPAALDQATAMLELSLSAYRQGDAIGAKRLAIAAYLEGFEPVEAGLDNLDPQLRRDIEREMMGVRELIGRQAAEQELAQSIDNAKALLQRAGRLLEEGSLSSGSAFAGALLILLREGLEAMLVLAAVITFVIRNNRRDALKYIHAGWASALVLGMLTWAAASWVIDISGAQREITEGVTALLASAMLVYVGLWLHGKSHARAWQAFLHGQIGSALEKKTLWSLAIIAFLAVYREIFETVLFYQALLVQAGEAGRDAMWAGMGSALVALALIGWAMLRLGLRLPLKLFFNTMAVLLAVMAVTFAGQGVAALQEAGMVQINSINFVSLPLFGVFPTLQTLAAQLAVLGSLILGLLYARRQSAA